MFQPSATEIPIFLRKINVSDFNESESDLNFLKFVTFILTCLLKYIKIKSNEFFPLPLHTDIFRLQLYRYISHICLLVCAEFYSKNFFIQSIYWSSLSCKGESIRCFQMQELLEDHSWKKTIENMLSFRVERALKCEPGTWDLGRALPLICSVPLGNHLNLSVPAFSSWNGSDNILPSPTSQNCCKNRKDDVCDSAQVLQKKSYSELQDNRILL